MAEYQENLVLDKVQRNKIDKSKKKKIAILLSVFFGIFSWFYTYGANKKKLWSSLAIVLLGLIVLYVPVLYSFFSGSYMSSLGLEITLWAIFATCIISTYIWALVDNIHRPASFYSGYPESILK